MAKSIFNKMFRVFIVMILAFILSAESVSAGILSTEDNMPKQEFLWSDENLSKMSREIIELKSENKFLKLQLEPQQSSCAQQIARLENLMNKILNATNSQASLEIQKTFYKDLLNVLSRNDSKLEDKSEKEGRIQKFSNCAEALAETQRSGIYNMTLHNYREPFPVYCDDNNYAGKWTVIQRRQDGSVDFFRNWTEYKKGFGDLNGEFFVGLDKLYALTIESPQELLIELEDFENEIRYAKYDAFAIGAESEDYALKILGSYSGNAGDSLTYHKSMKFSTKDKDNDKESDSCANRFKGAWWYNRCHHSNLNGIYYKGEHTDYAAGINWRHWRGDYYSYKKVRILIRKKV